MFCTNCGKPVMEGAKFCTNCGAPIAASPRAAVFDAQMTAPAAGMEERLTGGETKGTGPAVSAGEPIPAFVPGRELDRFKMMDKTRGTSSLASSLGNGTLYVYDNGLKFDAAWGASVGSGLLGVIASAAVNIAEAYDPNTYPLEQIQELRLGKRLGVYNTLVISMKNGDVWSFCPSVPGSKVPKLIISLLKPYIDRLSD